MSRFHAWLLALAGLLCVEGVARAQAQLIYEFANGTTGAAQNNFSVGSGSSIPIRVYLRDSQAGAPTLNQNNGLGAAGVRVTYGNGLVASVVNVLTDVNSPVPPWQQFNAVNGVPPEPTPSV